MHIKERLKDGIIVEGCKLHISEASVSDEVLVIPTRALRPADKDYAVAFAIPGDWDGLKQVVTIRQHRPRQPQYQRGFVESQTDSYLIFENCYIPWERVFLAGEWQQGTWAASSRLTDIISPPGSPYSTTARATP